MPEGKADRLSVIVPTLNEAENVEPLVRQIRQSGADVHEIIFVDDGSSDGTADRIKSLGATEPVRLIARARPTFGLSGAVLAGAKAAIGEFLVVMDADLSHPPSKIPELLKPIFEGKADMVIGSRYVSGGSTPGWPLWRKGMSKIAAALSYPLTRVHDSMCGFFAIRRELLLERASAATGFKIAFETIVHHGAKLRVKEIPIAFCDRMRGRSKMSFRLALLFAFRWLRAAGRLDFLTRRERRPPLAVAETD